MPRRVQDILPGERRSIRDVNIGKPAKRAIEEDETEIIIKKTPPKIPITPPKTIHKVPSHRNGKKSSITLILSVLGAIVIVGVLGYIASSYFSKAKFTIVPKSVPVDVNGTFVAQYSGVSGTLLYEIATLKGSATTTIPATDGQVTNTKAQGKVTLYNAATTSQRLIAGTRISNDDGNIYRTKASVVIPASKISAGKVVSGSITTTVIADAPGAEYNLTKTEQADIMRIVAYKGTPKYETVYARMLTDIIGGSSGTKKTVNASLLASTTDILKNNIKNSLLAQIRQSLPEDYILYENAYTATYSAPIIGGTDKNTAVITLNGTVNGIIFKKSNLSAKLAGEKSKTFGEFSYQTSGLDKLDFSIANPKEFSAEKKNTLITKMKGNIIMTADIPVEELKQKLAGLSLVKTQEIFKPYNAIMEKGSGELFPPWTKVPKDISRISIVLDNKN